MQNEVPDIYHSGFTDDWHLNWNDFLILYTVDYQSGLNFRSDGFERFNQSRATLFYEEIITLSLERLMRSCRLV